MHLSLLLSYFIYFASGGLGMFFFAEAIAILLKVCRSGRCDPDGQLPHITVSIEPFKPEKPHRNGSNPLPIALPLLS